MFKNESDFNFWLDKAKRDGVTDERIRQTLREWYYDIPQSLNSRHEVSRSVPEYVVRYLSKANNCTKLNQIEWNVAEIKHELERYRRIAHSLNEIDKDDYLYHVSFRVIESTKDRIVKGLDCIKDGLAK